MGKKFCKPTSRQLAKFRVQFRLTLIKNRALASFPAFFHLFALNPPTPSAFLTLQENSHTPRSQLPGTIFATAGWLVFSRVFSFYILHFWRLSYIYGSLTAVILIILWLYVIINLLFIGAGINAEMNGKTEQ